MGTFCFMMSYSIIIIYFVTLTGFSFVVFFFFQAEDGIRDLIVTGVQTCALPISCRERQSCWDWYLSSPCETHTLLGRARQGPMPCFEIACWLRSRSSFRTVGPP